MSDLRSLIDLLLAYIDFNMVSSGPIHSAFLVVPSSENIPLSKDSQLFYAVLDFMVQFVNNHLRLFTSTSRYKGTHNVKHFARHLWLYFIWREPHQTQLSHGKTTIFHLAWKPIRLNSAMVRRRRNQFVVIQICGRTTDHKILHHTSGHKIVAHFRRANGLHQYEVGDERNDEQREAINGLSWIENYWFSTKVAWTSTIIFLSVNMQLQIVP